MFFRMHEHTPKKDRGGCVMRVTLQWVEEDYKGRCSKECTHGFQVRDFWQPFLEKLLTNHEREEWVGKEGDV